MKTNLLVKCYAFVGGFSLGLLYGYCFLLNIPFSVYIGVGITLILSIILGIGNAVSQRIRCISLLLVAMCLGRPGRGVLKVVIFTYVIAGPISNMGENAREVVRVFACNAQFAANLSRIRQQMTGRPFREALRDLAPEIAQIKHTLRSFKQVLLPIKNEVELNAESRRARNENDYFDDLFKSAHRSVRIEERNRFVVQSAVDLSEQPRCPNNSYHLESSKTSPHQNRILALFICLVTINLLFENPRVPIDSLTNLLPGDEDVDSYRKMYSKKLEQRCELQFTYGAAVCLNSFATTYNVCRTVVPKQTEWVLCRPFKAELICNFSQFTNGLECRCTDFLDPGLGENYAYLKRVSATLMDLSDDVQFLVYNTSRRGRDIEASNNTSQMLIEKFEEKLHIFEMLVTAVHICVAFLFLRIVNAAIDYHDSYLTNIEYDNVYITRCFKDIDDKRRRRGRYTVLPLKKMESPRYTDVASPNYRPNDHQKLMMKFLKVSLETLTATTFVMLDVMFRKALEAVRGRGVMKEGGDGVRLEVEGTGAFASIIRKILNNCKPEGSLDIMPYAGCLPRPCTVAHIYYLYIYGGYCWTVLLLCINPYTVRLKRLICAYFYPGLERGRALHLYNELLKRRRRMKRTLRRKAAAAIKAHLLSHDNLLSFRVRHPKLLGWLNILPVARRKCLICEGTEPRNVGKSPWHRCEDSACPFVYCPSCWQDAGERCPFCDPSRTTIGDPSLSEWG